MAGRSATVPEVLALVLRDRAFYACSGGGMTLSGGEPMAQFEFTLALLQAARGEGLHTCMETSGHATSERFEAVLPCVDLFLFDLKHADPLRHRALTGVSNEQIFGNLDLLVRRGASVVLRCPLVPGINDSADDLAAIAGLHRRYPSIQGIDLLPYHALGRGKAAQLGRAWPLGEIPDPDEASKARWLTTLRGLGCTAAKLG